MLNLLIMKEIRDELGKAGHYNGIEPAYLNIEYDFVKVVYAVGDEIKGLGTKVRNYIANRSCLLDYFHDDPEDVAALFRALDCTLNRLLADPCAFGNLVDKTPGTATTPLVGLYLS